MKLSNKKAVQQIVCALADWGVRQVVICPGSRNAPFIISFNQHPAFTCTSVRDERSAAFFALGMALETQEPVVIVCTSGSAVLNFAPAIVEAYYLRVPIIVITADRPEMWINQGDGQTINQQNIYQNYIRASYNLDGEAIGESLQHQLSQIKDGLSIATKQDVGPVHFNVFLDEPLFGTESISEIPTGVGAEKKDWGNDDEVDFKKLGEDFSSSKKVMILVGQQDVDHELNDLLNQFGQFENTVILTETTSNVHHQEFIEQIDRTIMSMTDQEVEQYFPDLLITIGGAIVSKKVKSHLRKVKPHAHWNIHPYDANMNTFQCLTDPISMLPKAFFNRLLKEIDPTIISDYKQQWLLRKEALEKLHESYCASAPYSDFYVFSEIIKEFPRDTVLHLGNSSPIRYAQLFDNSNIKKTHANRGTSGIDGCTSTSMGAAFANPDQNFILISGDISFFYDNNALWNDGPIKNLKIIVINNSGGGIFRFIPGPATTDELEKYFEAEQKRSVKKLAELHDWNYQVAESKEDLKNALTTFFDPKIEKTILEIFTPQLINASVLNGYFKYLKTN